MPPKKSTVKKPKPSKETTVPPKQEEVPEEKPKVKPKAVSKLAKELDEMKRKPRREEFEEDLIFEDPDIIADDVAEVPLPIASNAKSLPVEDAKEPQNSPNVEQKSDKVPKADKKPRKTASKKSFESLESGTLSAPAKPAKSIEMATLKDMGLSAQSDPQEITKLIRLALAEELKQQQAAKEEERKSKQSEREAKRKAFLEKKQADKAAREAARKKEKEEDYNKIYKLVLQREAELNKEYATHVGRVRQRLML
jgi:hypothetical protein